MARLLRTGSLSPAGPVITHWAQPRPSAPRTARSCVAFRWELDGQLAGFWQRNHLLHVEQQPVADSAWSEPDAPDVQSVQFHEPQTVVVISQSNPVDTSTIRTCRPPLPPPDSDRSPGMH